MPTENKQCQNCKQDFTIEPEDFQFYEKIKVPPPTWCPECRFKRGALWRNERTLYKRVCQLCKKSIITMYNPKLPYIVYCKNCYESDQWDRYSYSKPYNSSRPFFEQLGELMKAIPKEATYISTGLGPNIGSDYTNFAGGNKHCYLLFNAGHCEEVMYSRGLIECRDVLDAYFGTKIERCYETVNAHHSNGIIFGQNVSGCVDSMFLLNTSGCQNCFGCVNLRNKSYHFMNESLSKEEWKTRVGEIMGSYKKMEEARKQFELFVSKFPRKENNNLKTINSTGDYLFECKNVNNSFEVEHSEDCKYNFSIKRAKDVYDGVGYSYNSELMIGCVAVGLSRHMIGCSVVENSQNIEYSFSLRSCTDCIGCDGLRNAQYCILNKQYSQEEYEKIREHIINELKGKNLYGLSMSPSVVPFAYNETIAQDNVPLTKDEALKYGFRWEDDIQATRGKETITPEQIPDHINNVPDDITKEILLCILCKKNYNITKSELQFYRKMILPIPRQCFNCRFIDRISRRGPFKLYSRNCAKCEKGIQTSYAPDRLEIVYCEECYIREVV